MGGVRARVGFWSLAAKSSLARRPPPLLQDRPSAAECNFCEWGPIGLGDGFA